MDIIKRLINIVLYVIFGILLIPVAAIAVFVYLVTGDDFLSEYIDYYWEHILFDTE